MENTEYIASRLTSIEVDAQRAKTMIRSAENDEFVVEHLRHMKASLAAIYAELAAQER